MITIVGDDWLITMNPGHVARYSWNIWKQFGSSLEWIAPLVTMATSLKTNKQHTSTWHIK